MATVEKVVIAAALIACLLLGVSPGIAESRDDYIESYRAQCRAQFGHLLGPGQQQRLRTHVRDCVIAKMRAFSLKQAPNFRLSEFTPWLVQNRGPANAKGVIYFILGWTGRPLLDSYRLVPYFLKSLFENGWDVVASRVPQNLPHQDIAGWASHAAAPTIVRNRLQQLKQDGYHRVILSGHSWGGWIALLTLQQSDAVVDALLVSAPSVGPKVREGGRPNAFFEKNFSEYPRLVDRITLPTVLIFYPHDDEDPPGRSELAKRHFEKSQVAHLIIDHPAGFKGHFAGWLPLFDYLFGGCIRVFLESVKTEVCQPPPLVNNDFRSIINLKQISGAEDKLITSAESLVGKKFMVFALDTFNREWQYVSLTQRHGRGAISEVDQAVNFRGGLHCSDGACRRLVKWSDREDLEFDLKSGDLAAWWIQR